MRAILRRKKGVLINESAFRLENKVIWIFSPEQWSNMRLSKHHYAEALALKGNRVYFFEPGNKFSKTIKSSRQNENLTIVNYPLKARGWGKLPAFLYSMLVRAEIKSILKAGIPAAGIVWCFDPLRAAHLSFFKKALTIYHPVDQFNDKFITQYPVKPHIAFSSIDKVRDEMRNRGWKAEFLHHGLAEEFAVMAEKRLREIQSGVFKNLAERNRVKVGFSGNLLGEASNREVMKKIIECNPDCDFHFWGKYKNEDSYIHLGSHHPEFIGFLQQQSNVVLHGAVTTAVLAKGLHQMNMLWMIWKTGNHPQWNANTNPHKVMEYLSTGVPILTHFMHTYKGLSLLDMASPLATENDFVELFNSVKNKVLANSEQEGDEMRTRILFALDHTYARLLDDAEVFINKLVPEYNA